MTGTVESAGDGKARVALCSGAKILATTARDFQPGSQATLMVRPEHARLVKAAGDLTGSIETIVYFGTDTIVHLQLAEGSAFIARLQNHDGAGAPFPPGAAVGVDLSPGALQVLSD